MIFVLVVFPMGLAAGASLFLALYSVFAEEYGSAALATVLAMAFGVGALLVSMA